MKTEAMAEFQLAAESNKQTREEMLATWTNKDCFSVPLPAGYAHKHIRDKAGHSFCVITAPEEYIGKFPVSEG